MSLSRKAANRPVTVLIIFVLVVLLSAFMGSDLAVDLLPDVELPFVAIFVNYKGASPEEVEKRITQPMESVLSSVQGLKAMSSVSAEGSATISIRLNFGENIDEKMNSIREKLDLIRDALPKDASTPVILKADPSVIPIMNYVVKGNRNPEEIRKYAETLTPQLEQISGVASANILGGKERAVLIEIPNSRLQAYNLNLTDISKMLTIQNIQVSGGNVTHSEKNFNVFTSGDFNTVKDINNAVISYKSGMNKTPVSIRLRDIADIKDSYKKETSLYFFNGEPFVQISIFKQSGKNSVQAAKNVKEKIKKISASLPSDIEIIEIINTTDIIERSIKEVGKSALLGALFAMMVLILFLRSIRSAFIIGVTIPISLIITLGIMFFSGMTLNIMTLAGLTLGVGMLVDNSIVILENIFSYAEKGLKIKDAAINGSEEMSMAISASTLTTVSVFLPLIIYRKELEIIGEIFQGLAFTVVISLLCSLAVALILIPVLTAYFFKKRIKGYLPRNKSAEEKSFLKKLDTKLEGIFTKIENGYAKLVERLLYKKGKTVLGISIIFILSCVVIPFLGFEYMPEQAVDMFQISVTLPQGSKLENTNEVLREMEAMIKKENTGIKAIAYVAGEKGSFGLGDGIANTGTIFVILPPLKERKYTDKEIQNNIRANFNKFPDVEFKIDGNGFNMSGGNSAIIISVTSDSAIKLKDAAHRIQNALIEYASDVITEPQIDIKDELPQVAINFDREKLYSFGLNPFIVGEEIRARISGIKAGRFKGGNGDTDIILSVPEEDKERLTDLDQFYIGTAQGLYIPISSFSSYEEVKSATMIKRYDQARGLKVNAGLCPNVPLNTAYKKVNEVITRHVPIEDGVIISVGGDYTEMIKALNKFLVIIIMAAMLVFGVMASQFESLKSPFIIIFTLPLCIIGIVIIFAVMRTPISVMTAVGLLILVGVIVNNGIVLIDYMNILMKRGLALHEACITGARSRLRPILMTTLTTVLGLVPMTFFSGEGSEMIQPIGQTILGGLLFGTLMTLFLMPVLYAIFNRNKEKCRDA